MRSGRRVIVGGVAVALLIGMTPMAVVNAAPRADIAQVERQVRELQMEAEAAHERAQGAQARLAEIQGDLGAIQNRAARERDELRVVVSTIDDIARATYASGGMDPALQVLMAEDPTEFLAQAAVMGQLESSQVSQLRRAQTTRLRLAQTEAEISDRQQAAAQASAEMEQAQAQADDRLAEAQQILSQLKEEERRRLEQLARERAQREREEAAAEAAALAADQAAATNDASQGQDSGGSGGSGDSGGSTTPEPGPSADGGGFSGGTRAAVAIQAALAQVGEPYSYSASPPDSWDCSKLTAWAWAQAGVGLTAISYAQWDQTQRIPVSEIQPGDLVFYFGSGAHHVGMYIGNGKMVHAANPTDDVEITDFLGPWYGERFSGVGRVVG